MKCYKRSLHIHAATVLASFILLSAIPAHADIYSTGFENPPFTLGTLNGQDGWTTFSGNSNPAIATVENFNVFAGNQAVFVDGSNTSQAGALYSNTPNAGPIVNLSSEIFIASSSTEGEWQFAGTGPSLGAAGVQFIGGIDLFPTAGGTTDNIELISSGFPVVGTFALNTWNNVDFQFNFATQTYSFFLNGSLIQSGVPFCGNAFGPCNGANVPTYNLSAFDAIGNGNVDNDSGFLDNFALTNDVSGVPEPGSVVLLGSAALLVGKKLLRRVRSVTC